MAYQDLSKVKPLNQITGEEEVILTNANTPTTNAKWGLKKLLAWLQNELEKAGLKRVENVLSIHELRSKIGVNGQYKNLLGYYEAGDKAPILYEWVEGNTGITDDGGGIIVSNSGYWKALFSDKVNIKDYGAKSEIGFDNADIINRCISKNTCSIVPIGIFEVSKTIKVGNRSKELKGSIRLKRNVSNVDVPTIKYVGLEDRKKTVVLIGQNNVGEEPTNDASNITIESLFIDANNLVGFCLYGTYVTNESYIYNLTFSNSLEYSCYVRKAWYASFRDLLSLKCGNIGMAFAMPLWYSDGTEVKMTSAASLEINGCVIDHIRSIDAGSNQPVMNAFTLDNMFKGYGIGIGAGNGIYLENFICERSKGVGLYVYNQAQPTKVIGKGYLENNNIGCPSEDKTNILLHCENDSNDTVVLKDIYCSPNSGGITHKGKKRIHNLENIYSPTFLRSKDFSTNIYQVWSFILKNKVHWNCGYINASNRKVSSMIGHGKVNTKTNWTLNITPNAGYALMFIKTDGTTPIGRFKITYIDGTTATLSYHTYLNSVTSEVARIDAKKIIKLEKSGADGTYDSFLDIEVYDTPITFY